MQTRRWGAALVMATVLAGGACSSSGSDAGTVPETRPSESTRPTTSTPVTASTSTPSTVPAALPEAWPDEITLPDGTYLVDAASTAGTMSASALVTSDPRAVYEQLRITLQQAGYTVDGSNFTETDQGGFGVLSAENDRFTVSAYVGPESDGKQGWVLTLTVGSTTPIGSVPISGLSGP